MRDKQIRGVVPLNKIVETLDARPPTGEGDIQDHIVLREAFEILLKSARRCARDLGHSIGNVPPGPTREMLKGRKKTFDVIFADTKDYRLKILSDLDTLEIKAHRAKAILVSVRSLLESTSPRHKVLGEIAEYLSDDRPL